ncbi:MAG: protein kinase domain-containing protein [Nannocystales bacterium]
MSDVDTASDSGLATNAESSDRALADELETALQMAGSSRAQLPTTALGRFVVLEKLGSGGMGTVFRAYDPNLDRSVALKVIRSESLLRDSNARARMAREARTLAKLNHPHVVGVHEVGTAGTQMFVAMEMVDGGDLAHWLAKHPDAGSRFAKTLDYVLQAGRGLAAAHEAGVVHRDFKPANVLLGTDGRVRVADFGLARTLAPPDAHESRESKAGAAAVDSDSVTQTNAVVGTPAYMAPEQRAGATPDALVDQYAFCVTAWEALFGKRPESGEPTRAVLPAKSTSHQRWIAKALRRGLSPDREARFPSMGPLLDALAGNPSLRRRRVVGGVSALAVVLAATAAFQLEREARCDDATAAAEVVWGPDARAVIERGFDAIDDGGVADGWKRFSSSADDYVQQWRGHVQDNCRAARIDGTLDTPTYEVRAACFDDRLARLAGALEVYEAPERDQLLAASPLAETLGPLQTCVDRPGPLAAGSPELMRELARGQGVLVAGDQAGAMPILERVADQAEARGFGILEARARLSLGLALVSTRGNQASAEMFERAYWLALEHGDDSVAAKSARAVSGTFVRLRDLDAAERWLKSTDALTARVGPDPTLRSDVQIAHGSLAMARRDLDAALTHYENARDIAAHWGTTSPEYLLAQQHVVLALRATGEMERAIEVAEEGLRTRIEHYGPTHPRTALGHEGLGALYGTNGQLSESVSHFEAAVEIYTAMHGRDHWRVASNLSSLGLTKQQLGDARGALAHFREAAQVMDRAGDPGHAITHYTRMNLGQALATHGRCKEAMSPMTAVTDVLLEQPDPDLRLAEAQSVLGSCLVQLGRNEEALDMLSAAREAYATRPIYLAFIVMDLARLRREQDDLASAEALLRELLQPPAADGEEPRKLLDPASEAEVMMVLGSVLAESGKETEAISTARAALALCRSSLNAPHEQVHGLGKVARTLLAAGALDEARVLAEEALELMGEGGLADMLAPPVASVVPLVLAQITRESDPARSRTLAGVARARLAETDSGFERELALAQKLADE